jgi:hypothetical protein
VITGLPAPGSAVVPAVVALALLVAVLVLLVMVVDVDVDADVVGVSGVVGVVRELPQATHATATRTAAARRAAVGAEPGRCIERRPGDPSGSLH